MLATIVSACASVITGMILFFVQRYFKQKEKHDNQAEERRSKKDVLVLKSLKAIGTLTVANAVALKEGKTNGEMQKAMKEFEVVDKELYDFLIVNTVEDL